MLPRHPGTRASRVTTSPDSHRDALALPLEKSRLYDCPPAMLMQSLYRAACFVTSSPEGERELRGRRYATALDRLLNACCPPAELSS